MAAPTVNVTIYPTTVTAGRVAPVPIVAGLYEGSTIGAGLWKQAFKQWDIDFPANGINHDDIVSPVNGRSASWTSNDSTGHLAFHRECAIGEICDEPGDYDHTGHVKNVDGDSGSDTASVTVTERADAKRYLVGSGGDDGSPTGAGTIADPLYYETLEAAVAAVSGNDNVIWLEWDQTHDLAGLPQWVNHHNWLIEAYPGAVGTVRPIVNQTANANVFDSLTSDNMVIRNLILRSQNAIGSTTAIAFRMRGNGMGIENCLVEGALGGNAFLNGVTISGNPPREGLVLLNNVFGATKDEGLIGTCKGFVRSGNTWGPSVVEWVNRDLKVSATGAPNIAGSVTRNTLVATDGHSGKGTFRVQRAEGVDYRQNVCTGGHVQISFDADDVFDCTFDGNHVTGKVGQTVLVLLADADNVGCWNNVLINPGTTNNIIGKLSPAGPGTPDSNEGVTFPYNTGLSTAANSAVNFYSFADQTGAGIGDWTQSGVDISHSVFAVVVASWTGKVQHDLDTAAQPSFSVSDLAIPDVAESYAAAQVDGGGDMTLEDWRDETYVDGATISTEAIDPSTINLAGGYRTGNTFVQTAVATVPGVWMDIHENLRGATSWLGAADAAPAAGAGSPLYAYAQQ